MNAKGEFKVGQKLRMPRGITRRYRQRHCGPLERELTSLIDKSKNERDVQPFFKSHLGIIGRAFYSNTHLRHVEPEFRLGAELQCDFLVLSSCSGWWSADFVELESPKARYYLKNRTPSKALRVALAQIDDWREWTRNNEPYLRSRLSALFTRIKWPEAAGEIRASNCMFDYNYSIVIGCRNSLSAFDQGRRATEYEKSKVNIATYDRLIEIARAYDGGEFPG